MRRKTRQEQIAGAMRESPGLGYARAAALVDGEPPAPREEIVVTPGSPEGRMHAPPPSTWPKPPPGGKPDNVPRAEFTAAFDACVREMSAPAGTGADYGFRADTAGGVDAAFTAATAPAVEAWRAGEPYAALARLRGVLAGVRAAAEEAKAPLRAAEERLAAAIIDGDLAAMQAAQAEVTAAGKAWGAAEALAQRVARDGAAQAERAARQDLDGRLKGAAAAAKREALAALRAAYARAAEAVARELMTVRLQLHLVDKLDVWRGRYGAEFEGLK